MRSGKLSMALGVVGTLLALPAAWGQYPSELVGFNGPPIDDPATSQEMFRIPEFSVTTSGYIVPNTPGAYDNDAAFRASGLQTEGAAALEVQFRWVDPADSDAWVRLTTFLGADRPNPSLHTEGRVRFKVSNRSELFQGEIGLCLGIRETDVVMPQLYDGGTSGTIEWVGVDTTPNGIIAGADGIVDTTAAGDDVQVYPVGYDINNDPSEPLPTGTAVIAVGPNGVLDTTPAGDDQVRFGYFIDANGSRRPIPAITLPVSSTAYSLEWDLATGTVYVDGVPHTAGIAGFTGDGDLSTPNSRGTLEHLAITNVASDSATLIDLAIDELQFEAPVPDPVLSPTIVAPILAGDESVTVTDLMHNVEAVSLYVNGGLLETQTVSTPDDVVFTIAPAVPGDVYTATQTVGGIESDPSDPVTVTFGTARPVFYAAPAEGDTSVLVMDLDPNTQAVYVVVNDATEFSAVPDAGADRVDVPVSGLVAGDVLTAYYTVGGAPSMLSDPETVTVASPTTILCDDFESYADQAALEAEWTQGGSPAVLLATDMNATCPSGAQSLDAPVGAAYMYHAIPLTTPTAVEPVVYNVNIYDPIGEDPNGVVAQWAELNHIGGPDWFLMHVGMLGWDNTDNIHYDFRAIGNGGPNWVDLDEYDAPLRTVGWHNFTVVHKGNYIDVYVDGLLSKKNVALSAETTYARADLGGGYDSGLDVWFDDLCVETGPVRFGCVAQEGIPGDIDGDGDVDLSDLAILLAAYGTCDGDANYNAAADLDGDNCVNLSDLAILLANYGTGT